MQPASRRISYCVFVLIYLAGFPIARTASNSTGFCEKFVSAPGLHCEEFTVRTRDLYLLSVQRIIANNDLNDHSEGSSSIDAVNGVTIGSSSRSVRNNRIGSVDRSRSFHNPVCGNRVGSVNDGSTSSANGRDGGIRSVHVDIGHGGSRNRSSVGNVAADVVVSHVNGSSNTGSVKNGSWMESEKMPVFLYHGMMQSGDIWVLDGPEDSLAFNLARHGYEVWIGNTRSSPFAHGHLVFSPSQKEFWDWDFDDLVDHDLPAMLKFVAKETHKKISFIGFSQGAMVGFASFTNKEISSLIENVVMLSPIVYLSHVRSGLVRMAATLFLDQLDLLLGATKFSFSDELISKLVYTACTTTDSTCDDFDILSKIQGPSGCSSSPATFDAYKWSSTAVKNIAQLAQMLRSGKFSKYDHGPLGNLFYYWHTLPPSYSIGELPKTLPVLLVHGGNDYIANDEDVRRLSLEISGPLYVHFLPNFAHEDFIRGVCANVDVYPRILEFLEHECNE